MKIGPQSIELKPLNEKELALCLLLVRTSLEKKDELGIFLEALEDYLFSFLNPGRASDAIATRTLAIASFGIVERLAWRRSVVQELWDVQGPWRGTAIGPTDIKTAQESFDLQILGNFSIHLPPFLFHPRSFRSDQSRKEIRKPRLVMTFGDAQELFEVFLARAILNGQLSRFSRCVVCGQWELKARSGRRSRRVFRHELEGKKSRNYKQKEQKWGQFWELLPRWPGLCSGKTCADKFRYVADGLSSFNLRDFPGLDGAGRRQKRPPEILPFPRWLNRTKNGRSYNP
jgi:hypothetical protein